MRKRVLTSTAALAMLGFLSGAAFAADISPGKEVKMVLLPKFLGVAVFDQAHKGALEGTEGAQESG